MEHCKFLCLWSEGESYQGLFYIYVSVLHDNNNNNSIIIIILVIIIIIIIMQHGNVRMQTASHVGRTA